MEAVADSFLESLNIKFHEVPKNRLAQNAATRHDMTSIIVNKRLLQDDLHVFSNKVEKEGKATNQKSSGRCWIFAACNIMRQSILKKYNLEDFELSQTYLFWFDKFEKSNYFLECILDTLQETTDSRVIQHLLDNPVNDGGQWDMLVNLVHKYGVVPKSAFPDTEQSEKSLRLNKTITTKLREYATILRRLHREQGKSKQDLRQHKENMLEEVHRILTIALGQPPKKFSWNIYDKDKKCFSFSDLTPKSFFLDHVQFPILDYVSIINDPRNAYEHLYTVKYLGNVVGGNPVLYVNLPVHQLKEYARKTIEKGDLVWFGCDVGQFSESKLGIMDMKVLEYQLLFDIDFKMSKAERLQYKESLMTHAMTLTGVHVEEGKVTRWRVENSWGEDRGEKGFFSMSDDWFSEFTYQVVIHKSLLPPEVVAILGTKPTELPPWDPMGSVASLV